jgi:RNA polymerase nonessential primary-like sigma factor
MTGSIRLPTNYHIALSKYGKLVKKYYQIEGRVPSLEKLADEIGISVSKLQLILTLTRGLASTDAPIRNGQNTGTDKYATSSLSETLVEPGLSPNEIVDLSFLRQSLENAMATELSPHERDVIRLRLGLDDGKGLTVKQVVNEFGGAVSVSEIRGMEARALKKLRAPNLDIKYNLREYMDLAGIDKSTMRFR